MNFTSWLKLETGKMTCIEIMIYDIVNIVSIKPMLKKRHILHIYIIIYIYMRAELYVVMKYFFHNISNLSW